MNNSTFTKQKVRPSYLDKSNFQYTYISQYAFEYLEYKMSLTLNNLEKRNERNLWTDSLSSKTRHLHEVFLT